MDGTAQPGSRLQQDPWVSVEDLSLSGQAWPCFPVRGPLILQGLKARLKPPRYFPTPCWKGPQSHFLGHLMLTIPIPTPGHLLPE